MYEPIRDEDGKIWVVPNLIGRWHHIVFQTMETSYEIQFSSQPALSENIFIEYSD